jgi:glutamate N-acetyltransferase / amino-acid N-acetyltransferase
VQFDQRNLGVQLGSMVLMKDGQPLSFDKAAANKYLKVRCTCSLDVSLWYSLGVMH